MRSYDLYGIWVQSKNQSLRISLLVEGTKSIL